MEACQTMRAFLRTFQKSTESREIAAETTMLQSTATKRPGLIKERLTFSSTSYFSVFFSNCAVTSHYFESMSGD